ncbi:hypothetical protein YC2023_018932 [Brassica napus]
MSSMKCSASIPVTSFYFSYIYNYSRSQTCLVIASRMFGTISLNPSRWKDSNSGQHVEYGQRPDVFKYC